MRRLFSIRVVEVLEVVVLALVVEVAGAGCGSVDTRTHRDVGLPTYEPTNTVLVAVLRSPPEQPNVRLGEVYVRAAGRPSVGEVEIQMKQAAGEMGADAVVIVSDPTDRMGRLTTRQWYGGQVPAEYEGCIVGVAIRYGQ